MSSLFWIIVGGLLMSAVAMVGGITTLLRPETLDRLLLPMVSLAAGTLLGGAFFHMIPETIDSFDALHASVWILSGFTSFLILEQFLHWHHSHHKSVRTQRPVTYLILVGDGLHNFLGGIGIASTFLIDPRAGIMAWIAAVAHEVPQEFGDFGVLVHGGWGRRRALLWNLLSALTFPLGAIFAYLISAHFSVAGLVLFGAGNFIYIAASDLVPEIKAHSDLRSATLSFAGFALGLSLMLLLAYGFRA
jgi:zinc and cadmium transporter